jgi:hypothetical protein
MKSILNSVVSQINGFTIITGGQLHSAWPFNDSIHWVKHILLSTKLTRSMEAHVPYWNQEVCPQ